MATTNFIPAIWNASMLTAFRQTALAAGLANREYQGNATAGNTVHLTEAVDVNIRDYSIGEGNGGTSQSPKPRTTAAEAVSDERLSIFIDQEKSFDFYIDDIDRAQAAGSLDAYSRSAAEGLAEDADKFLFSTAVTNAGTVLPEGALPETNPTGDQAFNVVRDLRKALNKNLVPQASRVLVVNAEFEAILLGADAKLTDASVSGDSQGLRSATLGGLLGFRVVTSENLPEVDVPMALAFYQPALAYISQIEKTEALRAQDKFADRLRGLHVYGGKVIRPSAVAVVTAADAG